MSIRWNIAQQAELQWWKRYLKGKSPEDYLAWKKQYWRTFLQQMEIPLPTEGQVLDAGCGPAGIFTILDAASVTAIDPLLDAYQDTLPHFNPNWYPGTTFEKLSLEALDRPQTYDTIFCLNAINHVADWQASMRNVIAALRPQGMLVLSSDAHRWPWLKPIFRALPGDILHPQQHDAADYRKALQPFNVRIQSEQVIKPSFLFNYMVWVIQKI